MRANGFCAGAVAGSCGRDRAPPPAKARSLPTSPLFLRRLYPRRLLRSPRPRMNNTVCGRRSTTSRRRCVKPRCCMKTAGTTPTRREPGGDRAAVPMPPSSGERRQDGSTITMQLARKVYGIDSATVAGKGAADRYGAMAGSALAAVPNPGGVPQFCPVWRQRGGWVRRASRISTSVRRT